MNTVPTDNATVTRLLDAAAKLFYEQGVNVGIAALCDEAGVSKRSMYQFFESKDEVLAAALARSVPGYLAALLPDASENLAPRARILRVFEHVDRIAADPEFRGCPYVSVTAEIKSAEHPARVVAREFHDTLTSFFRGALREAGIDDVDRVAGQLTAVHDGALAGAVVQGHATPGFAVDMAMVVLAGAGLRTDRRRRVAASSAAARDARG